MTCRSRSLPTLGLEWEGTAGAIPPRSLDFPSLRPSLPSVSMVTSVAQHLRALPLGGPPPSGLPLSAIARLRWKSSLEMAVLTFDRKGMRLIVSGLRSPCIPSEYLSGALCARTLIILNDTHSIWNLAILCHIHI